MSDIVLDCALVAYFAFNVIYIGTALWEVFVG